MLYGLRVVRRDELQTSPSIGSRLARNALLLIAPAGLPIEALVLIHHPLRLRVGDSWADTEVVEDPLAGIKASTRRSDALSGQGGAA